MPRLQTLGGLVILDEDGPVSGAASRGRNLALLAILARAGATGVSREKAAALLWPESEAQRSRHSLDQALYTIRRSLGADVFRATATTLALDPDVVESDVADFEATMSAGEHESALAAYSGPFLDGFHLPNAGEFERWVEGESAALHRQYAAALESVAGKATERGEVAEAVGFWRRLAAAEPLSSRVALGLMRSLDHAGDRTGALEAFRVHAALVLDELGSPPDPSVQEFEHELRSRREPRGVEQRRVTPAGETEATAPPAPVPGRPAGTERPDSAAPMPGRGAGNERSDSHAPMPASTADVERSAPGAPDPMPHRPVAPSHTRRSWRMAGAVVLAAAGVAGAAFVTLRPQSPPSAGLARVYVAPFQNETGDTAYTPVGRMAADWITEGLVRTGLVQVVEAGRSAESVVSGRIYLTGDTVRLNARITAPDDGSVLRAIDGVSATSGNPVAALEPLRQRVLGALGTIYDPRLAGWADVALHPPPYAAYLEFVAGLDLSAMPRDLSGATARFERAIALDPDFMAPRVWTAWMAMMAEDYPRADSLVASLAGFQDAMSPLERAWSDRMEAILTVDREASLRAARRMVEIAPRSAWVIALANAAIDSNRPRLAITTLQDAGIESLGQEAGYGAFILAMAYHDIGDYRAELEVSDEGIRLAGPSFGFLGPRVPALAALGRLEELELQLDALRDAPLLEGGSPAAIMSLATAVRELRAHGFSEAAVDLAARRLERDTSLWEDEDLSVPARRALLDLFYEAGYWDDAERLLDAAPAFLIEVRGMQALIAVRRGDLEKARSTLADLAAQEARFTFGNELFWRGRIASALGDHDEALSLIQQAFAAGQGGQARHLLHTGRDFEGLWADPRFQRMMEPDG